MTDGLLLGALLLLLGMGLGGAAVWLIERWHDGERAMLLRHIGHMQEQVSQLQDAGRSPGGIPEEEL